MPPRRDTIKVRRIAAPLIPSSWTADDLTVALEARQRRFFLGVQWHPESDRESHVIAALVTAAREYRKESH